MRRPRVTDDGGEGEALKRPEPAAPLPFIAGLFLDHGLRGM